MKKLNKILSIVLAFVMCAGTVTPSLAVTYDISKGDVTVHEDGSSTGVKENETEVSTNDKDEEGVIVKQSEVEATSNTITVDENTTTEITLDNVNIDVSEMKDENGKTEAALSIGEGSNVTVKLEGENKLVSGDGHAGLETNGDSVTITSADGDKAGDSLTAEGGDGGAGIGDGRHQKGKDASSSDIVIDNADVTAKGGSDAAGIGGGNKEMAAGADITFINSDVTATGGDGGVAIGNTKGEVNIGTTDAQGDLVSGGSIDATAGEGAAAIDASKVHVNKADSLVAKSDGSERAINGLDDAELKKSGVNVLNAKVEQSDKDGEIEKGSMDLEFYDKDGELLKSAGKDGKIHLDKGQKGFATIVPDKYYMLINGEAAATKNDDKHDRILLDSNGADSDTFKYKPTYNGVTYEFTTAEGETRELPSMVNTFCPKDEIFETPKKVTKDDLVHTAPTDPIPYVQEEGGYWEFVGWKDQTKNAAKDDDGKVVATLTFVGVWKWHANEEPEIPTPCTEHDYVVAETKAATCTEGGYTKSICSKCGDVKTETTEKLGHSFGEWEITKAVTCTEEGSKTRECSRCGYSETETIPAKGHTEETVPGKAATCTETGLTEGKKCTVCGTVTVAQETIPAKGHKEVIDPAKEPTCTETGLTEGKHCSVCNTTLVAQEEVAAKGHTEVTDKGYAATCTTEGKTDGKHCSVCNTVLIEQKTLEALDHAWDAGEVTTEPTCEGAGEKTFTCKRDPSHKKTETVSSLGGHKGEWMTTKEPTCTETGLESEICTKCHTVLNTKELPAKDHALGEWEVTKAATCTEEGSKTRECSRCDYSETENIAMIPHTVVVDNAVEPDCVKTGLTEGKHCSVCGTVTVEQEVVAAKGHTEAIDAAVEPTCTETGLTEGKHCSVCDTVLVEQEVVDVLGHDWGNWTSDGEGTDTHTRTCMRNAEHKEALAHVWGEWVVTTPATTEAEGVETATCAVCGAAKTQPIAKLQPATPDTPSDPDDDDDDPNYPYGPDYDDIGGDDFTNIEDVAVPLAGLITRSDIIGYLWQMAGSPDAELSDFADVPADHMWAVAIGWAQDVGIAVADEEGNFRPDDLVLRSTEDIEGELQEFLNRYAVFAGVAKKEELFIVLEGEADDVIMGEDAMVILKDFFEKLEDAQA